MARGVCDPCGRDDALNLQSRFQSTGRRCCQPLNRWGYAVLALGVALAAGLGIWWGATRPEALSPGRHRSVGPPAPQTRSARARQAAVRWYGQARQRAIRQLEGLDAWDEEALQRGGGETWRREAMAGLPELQQAIRAAEQAIRLATTADERYKAALLLTRLTCDASQHRRELGYAWMAMALRPHRQEALMVLYRAAGCNHLAALARQAGADIERLSGPATSADAQLDSSTRNGTSPNRPPWGAEADQKAEN